MRSLVQLGGWRSGVLGAWRAWSLSLVLGLGLTNVAWSDTLTRTSGFEYDATTGLLTKEVVEPTNSALCQVTSYTYDAYGNKTAATVRNCSGNGIEAGAPTGDAVIASRTSNNTYDGAGQFPITTTNALGQAENKTYDPRFGAPVTLTGPNNLTTTWQYDDFGRKIKELRSDGTQTRWDYLYCNGINGGTATCPTIGGAAGAYLVQVTPLASDGVTQNGPLTRTYYDALDRVTRVETQGYDGNGSSTPIYQDTLYDSLGRAYQRSRPYYAGQTAYWDTMTYDSANRQLSQTNADGAVNTTSYNGLVMTVTNPNGQARTVTKNSQNQIISVTDTNNQSVTYHYDAFGNLVQTVDALGNSVTMTYDLRGRKTGMVDPDRGTWTYTYDALGELIHQTDALSHVSTLAYDLLGRMTSRTEADLVSHWYYDTYQGGGACTAGIGKLCQSTTSTGYNQVIAYDSQGRPNQTTTTVDTTYTAGVTYDANGRVSTQTYPGGIQLVYNYTPLGYLQTVKDATSGALYWQANSLDAEGHVLQQTDGNNVVTQQTYNPANGRLTGIVAGAGNQVQNLTYTYDALGNVISRNDATQNLAETFVYDSLNRVTSATVNASGSGVVTTNYAYDVLGNIQSRSDVGSYVYNASGTSSVQPHAVNRVNFTGGGYATYSYDGNGSLSQMTQYDANSNVISGKGRTEVYTSFAMPQAISANGYNATFYYGPDHQRVQEVSSSDGTTIYLNPDNTGGLAYEKTIKPDNSVEQRSFITAGGSVVAVIKQLSSGTTAVYYFHRDNLGSTAVVTDANGNVVERLAYEPFGKRRFPNGLTDPNDTITAQTTDRGFTNHEHLDDLGLIHMNGRIFDPLIGRFTSADPQIQDPTNLQSYNRYSYGFNNPLAGMDPSGYGFLSDLFHPFVSAWHSVWDSTVGRVAVVIVVSVITDGAASDFVTGALDASEESACLASNAIAGQVAGAAAGGFVGGVVGSNGSLKQGVIGGLTNVAFYGVGSTFNYADSTASAVGNVMGHALVGCASSAAGGGKCGSGALSAGIADFAGNNMPANYQNNPAFGTTYSAIVGGTVSSLTGGKFITGAETGAFGYLYNYCSHDGQCTTKLEQTLYNYMPGYQVGTCINDGDCTAGDWTKAVGGTALAIVGGIETKEAGIGLTELMSYGENATSAGAGEGLVSLNMTGRSMQNDFAALATNYGATIENMTTKAGQTYQRFTVGDVTVSLRNFGNSGPTIQVTNGLREGIKMRY